VGIRRRALPIILAAALSLPFTAGSAGPAAAACTDTWTSLMTSSKSGSYGIFDWYGSVNYKLKFNTCNLGVYTQIYLDRFYSSFYVRGQPGFYYQTPFAGVLKNCNGFTTGCLIDQGDAIYFDTRVFTRTGPGYLTRTAYPRIYYPYSTRTALMDSVCNASCEAPLVMVIYQFRNGSGALYMDSGVYNVY
jgi:hypothetical protein